MATERRVAGLLCSEVLAELSEYLEGELPAARVAQIEAHLAGCDWCERFGREFASTVAELRSRLKEPEPLSAELEAKLAAQLKALP